MNFRSLRVIGTGLLLLTAVAAGPVDPAALAGPRLTRGDELVYRGRVTEAGERVDRRFRKESDIEVRVFVIEVAAGTADCAVLTCVRRREDPHVVRASAIVTGSDARPASVPPAASIELVRLDGRGRAVRLRPDARRPPIVLTADTPTARPEPIPLDSVPDVELGMFVPLPTDRPAAGSTWDVSGEVARPPVSRTVVNESAWNGGRCVEITAVQRTTDWDRPADGSPAWRRTETARISPDDGIARTLRRRIEHRVGGDVERWVEIEYELQPPCRHVGPRYADLREDAEAAFVYAAEFGRLGPDQLRADPHGFERLKARIARERTDRPTATTFGVAIDSVLRQCDAAARGEYVTTAAAVAPPPVAPQLGRTAPDFLAPPIAGGRPVRLEANRGKPVVLVVYLPEDELTPRSLAIAEALHTRYAGRAVVVPLAVTSDAEPADREREKLGLTVPIHHGTEVGHRYAVDSYPRFYVVGPDGRLTYQFDGVGNETGFLIDREVRQHASPPARPEKSERPPRAETD